MPDPMESSHHREVTGNEPLRTPARPVKTDRGHQEADGVRVVLVVEELLALGADLSVGMVRELPLALEMRAHSPTGFSWGYGGSGPAQLALALLADALGDRELAQQHYQSFERDFVAKWASAWSITVDEIRNFVAKVAEVGFPTGDAAADGTSVLAQGQVRFSLGEVCVTPKVAAQIPPGEVRAALARHERGDWGEVEEIERAQNERHLQQGGMLLSDFRSRTGLKYWILTEWDRTRTTVFLTEEY